MKTPTMMFRMLMPALKMLLFFSVLTGFLYPAFILAIAQTFFPFEANGSLIMRYGTVIGSTLIGQSFTEPQYFWGRLSATPDYPYNAMASSGSNLFPGDPQRLTFMQDRLAQLHASNEPNADKVPIDLLTASGSGLDPDISIDAARYQINRIAKVRKISPESLEQLIKMKMVGHTEDLLEPPRVNVLQLNMALDILSPTAPTMLN